MQRRTVVVGLVAGAAGTVAKRAISRRSAAPTLTASQVAQNMLDQIQGGKLDAAARTVANAERAGRAGPSAQRFWPKLSEPGTSTLENL